MRQWHAEHPGSAAPPAHAQVSAVAEVDYTHGVAYIGRVVRRMYFDLGGIFNLLDDACYDELVQAIVAGELEARLLTPEDLGYTSRGVPIDVAAATESGGSSIIRVKRWMRITLRVRTDTGRYLTLTNTVVGFVRRATPLLILGKNTCGICGYRSIEEQDEDRRRRGDDARSSQYRALRSAKGSAKRNNKADNNEETKQDTAADGMTASQCKQYGKQLLQKAMLESCVKDIVHVQPRESSETIAEPNDGSTQCASQYAEVEVITEKEFQQGERQLLNIAVSEADVEDCHIGHESGKPMPSEEVRSSSEDLHHS